PQLPAQQGQKSNVGVIGRVGLFVRRRPIANAAIAVTGITAIAFTVSPKLRAKVFGKKETASLPSRTTPTDLSGSRSKRKTTKRRNYKTVKI
ncbi:hypothetical protein V6O07_04500, partial [Arthrospira platensis SPKY2]